MPGTPRTSRKVQFKIGVRTCLHPGSPPALSGASNARPMLVWMIMPVAFITRLRLLERPDVMVASTVAKKSWSSGTLVALTPDRIEALHEFRPVGRARRARRCYDHTEQQAARPVPIQAGRGSGAAFEMRRSLTLGLCLVDGRRGTLRPMGVNSGMAGFGIVGCKSTPARGLFKWHRISRGLRAPRSPNREFSDFLKNYLSEPREPPRPLGPKLASAGPIQCACARQFEIT